MGNSSVLKGYRVLDLTDELGTLCSKLLADMGAEVIRIEKPGKDINRLYGNAGQRSISLNVEMEEGRDLFKRLMRASDIVVESYSPGYLGFLGLSYTHLSQINSGLIMASITSFGQTGPYRDYKSSELVASALGGQMNVCGEPDKPPLKPFGPQAYSAACLFAACGILLALRQRHFSGKGQYIDISIHECAAGTLDHVLVRYFYEGVVAERGGSLHWNKAFRIFRCKDGYILLSLNHQWETLVEWLHSEGRADDLREERWLSEDIRRQNMDHIIAVLEKWTYAHGVDELVELGQLMHFPWARVCSIADVVSSPQLNERGFINPNIPRAGEHNLDVYRNILGLSEVEIKRLTDKGVI